MSGSGTYLVSDKSVTQTGSSTAALVANPYRNLLIIQNVGAANMGVNLVGGTAAIGGTGTLTLVPQGSLILTDKIIQNAITTIGTSTQILVIFEG